MNKGQTPERIQPLTDSLDFTQIPAIRTLASFSHKRPSQQIVAQEKGKPGLRGKINAKCVECLYDESQPGSWRQQVEACTCPSCPLFDARARSEKSGRAQQ